MVMSKEKYPGMFLHQMEAIYCIYLQQHSSKLGNSLLRYSLVLVGECLDQSCESKNI